MMSLSTVLDLALLLTSGTAILYCAQLTKKLKALHDLKSGVGEAIVSLSKQIKTSEEANASIVRSARDAVKDLQTAIDSVEAYRQQADDLVSNLDGQVARAKQKLSSTLKSSEEVASNITVLTGRARLELKALRHGVEIASRVNALKPGTAANERRPAPAPAAKRQATVHELQAAAGRGQSAKGQAASKAALRETVAENPYLKALKTG